MGKSLIIKGADFSENAIEQPSYLEATLYQGLISANPESETYGRIALSGSNYPNFLLTKIFIPAESSIKVRLKDGDSLITAKSSAAVFATNDSEIEDKIIVNVIVGGVYPRSTDMVQQDGSYLFVNNNNYNIYAYITWGEVEVPFSVIGKIAEYIII